MQRKRFTAKERERLFKLNDGVCHLCGYPIDSKAERYEIEHVIPFALTQDNRDSNCKPAHVSCHKQKTHGDERAMLAKVERIRQRHEGHRPAAVGNRRIPSRPFYNPRRAV